MKPSGNDSSGQGGVKVLRPEEIIAPAIAEPAEEVKPLRVRLKPSDFEKYGYTSGCQGCRAIIRKGRPQSHSEECRARMEAILDTTDKGRKRKQTADNRINAYIAEKLEEDVREKRVKVEEGSSSSSGINRGDKRLHEGEEDNSVKRINSGGEAPHTRDKRKREEQ